MPHEILNANEFTPELASVWDNFLDANEDFSSPFFAHEFAMAVGRHRPDLRIAVLRNAGDVTGFLPFHLGRGGCAAPVGGQICDYQGVIGEVAEPGRRGAALMRACGLSSYDFNHGLAGQGLLAGNAFGFSVSTRVDLRDGLEGWQAEIRAKSRQLTKLKRMARKIEQEQGELRFVRHDGSDTAWREFAGWKDKALRDQGAAGFPGQGWVSDLLQDIRNTDTPRFAGLFSTLYAGDQMIAAHLGMRSDRAWNWWFPSYDPEMQRYRPGLLLLLACIEEAAGMGLKELDFGRGTQLYKTQYGNRVRKLCEGSLERPETVPGALRVVRKAVQRLANRTLPERASVILRSAGAKALRAGSI